MLNKKFKRQADIVWRDEGGAECPEIILVVSDMIHQLNPVGSRVWILCDGSKTVGQIINVIAAEYEVAQTVAQADVESFVNELAVKGWLVDG